MRGVSPATIAWSKTEKRKKGSLRWARQGQAPLEMMLRTHGPTPDVCLFGRYPPTQSAKHSVGVANAGSPSLCCLLRALLEHLEGLLGCCPPDLPLQSPLEFGHKRQKNKLTNLEWVQGATAPGRGGSWEAV